MSWDMSSEKKANKWRGRMQTKRLCLNKKRFWIHWKRNTRSTSIRTKKLYLSRLISWRKVIWAISSKSTTFQSIIPSSFHWIKRNKNLQSKRSKYFHISIKKSRILSNPTFHSLMIPLRSLPPFLLQILDPHFIFRKNLFIGKRNFFLKWE